MASRFGPVKLAKVTAAVAAFGGAAYFLPYLTAFYVAAGIVDVCRHRNRTKTLLVNYFLRNGLLTWALSPLNLFVDLLCDKNKGIHCLDDLPPAYRGEIEEVLSVFAARKADIVGRVDGAFDSGRRGMFLYRWFGKRYNAEIAEFNRPFEHIQTIAVSVFRARESTSLHFGPARLTLRVLYNLDPVESDGIYIECDGIRHYWHEDPLFIFDDTLMHRSVNDSDARRYCVFVDILRPSPYPRAMAALARALAGASQGIKGVFYDKWKILGAEGAAGGAATKP